MRNIIVVDNPTKWPLRIEGVEVVSARNYIYKAEYNQTRNMKVFNLCRSYRYQAMGYYVSLLAEARGHKPMPGVTTIQDMKSQMMVRFISEDLDELIQKKLSPIKADKFVLSVYFGRNLAKCYDKLSLRLFSLINTPFLRADFVKQKKKWIIQNINPIAAKDIPDDHRPFVDESAMEYFSKRRFSSPRKMKSRFDMAILVNPDEKKPPSCKRSIRKFVKAAISVGFSVELITREDYGRIAEFDALFIRETTSVNHHTYRFARRAAAEGLVVIDDPESILKCTNKVFLAELLQTNKIRAPQSMIVDKGNATEIGATLGFPCILKKPDSSFSQGVCKATNENELKGLVKELLSDSDLIIAQQFIPTDFDWRVAILDKKPLFVCKYYMAEGHWQIINYNHKGKKAEEGLSSGIPIEETPPTVLKTALKAANLIGDGFYGVDLKEVGNKVYVIEINDNPSIDAGFEDEILKDHLYLEVMKSFLKRVECNKEL